ncbi:hypothetical protein HRbin02_01885 [Candidatus Calditenuaceae archaeon HR02]|nr:hypothetical protein HRbin02_01885 [Candidatus Calditenuaceae archaeon HR02]
MNRPLASTILLLIAGGFYIIGGFVAASIVGWLGALTASLGASGVAQEAQESVVIVISTGFVSGGGIIVGALLVWTGTRRKVLIGGIIALIFSLIGIINTIGGLIVGLVLTIVGAVLAFTWKAHNAHTSLRTSNYHTSSNYINTQITKKLRNVPDRCPRCGGYNIVGYTGIYDCFDCGYKFAEEHV